MKTNHKTVAIAEPSFLMQRGLLSVLSLLHNIDPPFIINPRLKLQPQVRAINPDVVIVNPLLVGYLQPVSPREYLGVGRQDLLIALQTTPMNNLFLDEYDGVLSAADSEKEVVDKLNQLLLSPEELLTDCSLGKREVEVLCLVAKGWASKQIADMLNISVHTVISHRRNIIRKLNIHTTSGLTVYAVMNKLITMDDIASHN